MTDETSGDTAGDLPTEPDPGAFASRVAASLPFNQLVGLRCHTAPVGSAEVVLPADERLANHLGSVHAVAELAPAEAAGGIAAVSGLSDLVEEGWLPVARSLRVRYVALAHGTLTATATLDDDTAADARAAANDGDRVELTLAVTVSSADGVVAEVEIDYVFKRFDGPSGS